MKRIHVSVKEDDIGSPRIHISNDLSLLKIQHPTDLCLHINTSSILHEIFIPEAEIDLFSGILSKVASKQAASFKTSKKSPIPSSPHPLKGTLLISCFSRTSSFGYNYRKIITGLVFFFFVVHQKSTSSLAVPVF